MRSLFREVEQKGRQLAVANEHKARFFANMSHELRTPLNGMLGFSELLVDGIYGQLPDPALEVLGRVQKDGRHLLGLINDVLDISKIDADQLRLSLDDYSMQSVVETVVASTGPLAQAKGIEVKTSISADLPIGRGDERRLTQVLLNIVGNAIKFTDTGSVEIRVSTIRGHFRLRSRTPAPASRRRSRPGSSRSFSRLTTALPGRKAALDLVSRSRGAWWMFTAATSMCSPPSASAPHSTSCVPVRVTEQRSAA